MKSFNFDKKEAKMLTLEIEGIKFSFNPKTAIVADACKKFNARQNPLNKILSDKNNLTDKKVNDTVVKSCMIVKETINTILGKRAYERIFANRTANFQEHMDVVTFLFNNIKEFAENERTKHIN